MSELGQSILSMDLVSHINLIFKEQGPTSLSRVCVMVIPDEMSPAMIHAATFSKDVLPPTHLK